MAKTPWTSRRNPMNATRSEIFLMIVALAGYLAACGAAWPQ